MVAVIAKVMVNVRMHIVAGTNVTFVIWLRFLVNKFQQVPG